jgi:hypothetical protein
MHLPHALQPATNSGKLDIGVNYYSVTAHRSLADKLATHFVTSPVDNIEASGNPILLPGIWKLSVIR